MANQLFYPKSTFIYQISGESNKLFFPSPRNRVQSKVEAGATTAGSVIESPIDLTKANIIAGMAVYNVDTGSSLRGSGSFIKTIDYTTNKITTTFPLMAAGERYEIYVNKPDPCVIMTGFEIGKNDVFDLVDAEGNLVTYDIGKLVQLHTANLPLPFQVIQLLKTSNITSPIICMWN
tara:strand:- start:9214 stop:9744 length:531 start_codon:yes stop_codon:yes gene_type:complete